MPSLETRDCGDSHRVIRRCTPVVQRLFVAVPYLGAEMALGDGGRRAAPSWPVGLLTFA
jgi:hypothetical protein